MEQRNVLETVRPDLHLVAIGARVAVERSALWADRGQTSYESEE
jgi:hypothetical protein